MRLQQDLSPMTGLLMPLTFLYSCISNSLTAVTECLCGEMSDMNGVMNSFAHEFAPTPRYHPHMAHHHASSNAPVPSMPQSLAAFSLPPAAPAAAPVAAPALPGGDSGPAWPMAPSISSLTKMSQQGLPATCAATIGGGGNGMRSLLDAASALDPSMMATARLWTNMKATQGQGDMPPVMQLHKGGAPTTMFVNPIPLESAVTGRSRLPDPAIRIGPDTFIDDGTAGFIPASTWGIVAAPIQPAQFLQAMAPGLAACRGGEMPITRRPGPTTRVSGLNLTPVSDDCFVEQKNRLNYMLEKVALSKLAAAGWMPKQ